MRELIGMVVAVVIIFGAGGAIFSAIRHRRTSVGDKSWWPPKPPPRPPCRPVSDSPLALDRVQRRGLDELTANILMETSPIETMKRVRSIAVRIVSHLLQRLDVNAIVGTGTVRCFDEGRPWDTPNIQTIVIAVDNDYRPSIHERVAFFGVAKEITRPTLEELRARLALAEAPPVCPDCGGIMHKEADVDPEGLWFVSWRCDCQWTPTEGG